MLALRRRCFTSAATKRATRSMKSDDADALRSFDKVDFAAVTDEEILNFTLDTTISAFAKLSSSPSQLQHLIARSTSLVDTLNVSDLVKLSLAVSYALRRYSNPITDDNQLSLLKALRRRICLQNKHLTADNICDLIYAQSLLPAEPKFDLFLQTELCAKLDKVSPEKYVPVLSCLSNAPLEIVNIILQGYLKVLEEKQSGMLLASFGEICCTLNPQQKISIQEKVNSILKRKIHFWKKTDREMNIFQVPVFFCLADLLSVSTINLWLESSSPGIIGPGEQSVSLRNQLLLKIVSYYFQVNDEVLRQLSPKAREFLEIPVDPETPSVWDTLNFQMVFGGGGNLALPGVVEFPNSRAEKSMRCLEKKFPGKFKAESISPFLLLHADREKKICVEISDSSLRPFLIFMRGMRRKFLENLGWRVFTVKDAKDVDALVF